MLAALFAASTLFAAVLVHELGHVLACRLFGFGIDRFAVWPFCFSRFNGKWRLVRFARKGLGYVGVYPIGHEHLRSRIAWVTAFGPLVSIFGGGVAAISAIWLEGVSAGIAGFAGGAGFWSLLLGFTNLIPVAKPGRKSDGSWILDLLRGKPGIVNVYAVRSLVTSCEWVRPREWNREMVELAIEALSDSTVPLEVELAVQWARYQWYADTGGVDKAGEAIEWILRQNLPRHDRLTWEWEFVWFHAFSGRSADSARERARIAEGLMPSRLTYGESREVWKCRAAIAACEGRIEEARNAAAKAVSFARSDKSYAAGLLKALEFDLAELIEGCNAGRNAGRLSARVNPES